MSKPFDHEQALIRAFFVPQSQERHLELPARSTCRSDARFKRLDEIRVTHFLFAAEPVPDLSNLALQGARDVCQMVLNRKRATVKGMPTEVAREGIGVSATLPSGFAGRLGYFEDEDQRAIFERTRQR
jgi:hypothetical protein